MTSAAQLVNRQYVANSCTLEITAAESVLSQWSQQPVLKQVRFRVLIDDPETEQPELITQGNQTQLQRLTDAVQQYVQTHLAASGRGPESAINRPGEIISTGGTWPLGQHRLTIDPKTDPLTLSTLDLFDLAEVLDQCDQNLQLLPTIASTVERRRRPLLKSYSLWVGSAVAAMVLAVGVTQTLRQQYETALSPQADSVSESAVLSQEEQELDRTQRDVTADAAPLETTADAQNLDQSGGDASSAVNSDESQSVTSEALGNRLPGVAQSQPESAAAGRRQQTVSPADRTERAQPRQNRSSAPEITSRASRRPASPRPSASEGEGAPVSPVEPSVVAPSMAEAPSVAAPPTPVPSASSPSRSGIDPELRGDLNLSSASPEAAASSENLEGFSFDDFLLDSSPSSTTSESILGSSDENGEAGNFSAQSQESPNAGAIVGSDTLAREPSRPTEASVTVNEVTEYFQQRWQGGEGDETLIYEVQLNPAGTIAAINPLNVPALRRRWSIPEDAIATPFMAENPLTLRVVLYPDGQVQVSD